tara:strand:- start:1542 stop:1883 length:342 start_codon:yes stop_codon:yes gene_type:complete
MVVCIAWVFFRAEDLSFALTYTATMLGFGGGSGSLSQLQNLALQSHILMAFIAGIFLATPIYPWFSRSFVIPVLEGRPRFYFLSQLSLIFSLLAFALLATASTTYNPFIYFRF